MLVVMMFAFMTSMFLCDFIQKIHDTYCCAGGGLRERTLKASV